MCVADVGQLTHAPDRPDVGGVGDEDGLRVGSEGERGGQGLGSQTGRHTPAVVELGRHPDRLEPREHETEEHRAVERALHDDALTGSRDGEGQGLVAVRRAADGEAAEIGSPEPRRARLSLLQEAAGELHLVEAAVERHVVADDLADEVGALLVPGDRERVRRAVAVAEPRVEERSVPPESSGVAGVRRRLSHQRARSRRSRSRGRPGS